MTTKKTIKEEGNQGFVAITGIKVTDFPGTCVSSNFAKQVFPSPITEREH